MVAGLAIPDQAARCHAPVCSPSPDHLGVHRSDDQAGSIWATPEAALVSMLTPEALRVLLREHQPVQVSAQVVRRVAGHLVQAPVEAHHRVQALVEAHHRVQVLRRVVDHPRAVAHLRAMRLGM